MSSPEIRCDNSNSSNGVINQKDPSIDKESVINSSSDLKINSESNPNSLSFSNQDKNYKNDEIKRFLKDNKNEENQQKQNVIQIKKEGNDIEFFIKAKGHNLSFYKVDKDSVIKNIIENYIQKQKLGENIKNNFFCGDKLIDNLEAKLSDLKIKPLDIIIEK